MPNTQCRCHETINVATALCIPAVACLLVAALPNVKANESLSNFGFFIPKYLAYSEKVPIFAFAS